MRHKKIEDWLKTIKKDLSDGDLKEILKICYRLFYGAKTFNLEEFIENVLSKGETKTEVEAPINWIKVFYYSIKRKKDYNNKVTKS